MAASAGGGSSCSRLMSMMLLLSTLLLARVGADGGWIDGERRAGVGQKIQITMRRATYYGNDGGATIHQGSCLFGYLDGKKGTGWDIAAISDSISEFDHSCGKCFEIMCRPAVLSDGYGQKIDRSGSGVCQSGKTVTVMITDACPCNYPANAWSNKRWCCGDAKHFDLSYVAFNRIANSLGLGVIGIKYRQVSCPSGSPVPNNVQSNRNRKGVPGSY